MAKILSDRQRAKLKRRNPAVAYALDNGWDITVTNNNHLRLTKGDEVVFGASTPSDCKSDKNFLSRLQRIDKRRGEFKDARKPQRKQTRKDKPVNDSIQAETVSVAEAAKRLGISEASVLTYMSPKQGRLVRAPNGEILKDSLERYIRERAVKAKSKGQPKPQRKVSAPKKPAPKPEPKAKQEPVPDPEVAEDVDTLLVRHIGHLEALILSLSEAQQEMGTEALDYVKLHLHDHGLIEG